MAGKEDKKEPEKILVDKEFLELILKTQKDLQEKMEELEKRVNLPISPATLSPDDKGYMFQCMEMSFYEKKPSTPQDIINHKTKLGEFRKKLETLMKEYKVGQATAVFLKKL